MMDLATIPKSRAEALALGTTHYFTGKPCKHGHIAPRVTKGTCTICRELEWAQHNKRRAEQPKSDAAKAAGKRYYERNKELVKRRANAQQKEKRREYRRTWKQRNPDAVRLATNLRRRRLRNATPIWLTDLDKALIKEKYKTCAEWTKQTGVRYVVDHVIPLEGEFVCGLHVPENLQIIPHALNVAKGSRFNT